MALNVFKLFGTIALDNSGAMSSMDKTVEKARKSENALSETFKKIGTAVAAAFTVSKIVDFGKACTEAYASIAAEESAFAQIMGDYADTAQEKLLAVSDATGVASTRLTSSMTSLTAKFKGLGYNVEDATTLAADGLLIASDAAAFWDMSLDESMSHLNSFINGSYEGGEAIGLFANDTQMAAYAIEKGIVADAKAWAALDEATKQATRLDYAKNMQEQSGATGQAAKEADAYANVMANLKEYWRQFQGVIGKPVLEKFVLPVMQKLNAFMPKLNESVQNGIVWLETGFGKIKDYFSEVFTEDGINIDALPDALTNMFRDLGRSVGGWLSSFGRTLQKGWANTVWPMTQRAFKATFGIDVPGWSEIELIIKNWWDGGNGIAAAIASVCNWTLNLFGAPATVTQKDVADVLSSWWDNTVAFVQNACGWALGLFSPPEDTEDKSAVGIITEWWNGVRSKIEEVCQIDLTKVNVAGIFTAAQDALDSLILAASDLVNDILKAVSSNENGEVVLNARLSGLFDAGVNAIADLLAIASTLVADIVGAVTGKEEDAEKIGAVFSELFGVASEVVIGVKDDVLGIFDWFLKNGEIVAPIITTVALAMGSFLLAHPAIAVITALTALVTALTVDWANFESNYPQLVQMFKDLTGLDFTNVANSLTTFQTGLQGIVDWFVANEATLDMMLMILGGIVFFAHPVAGAALIAYGAGDLWTAEGVQKEYAQDLEETGVPRVIQDPFINNSDSFIDWASIFHWFADSKKETEEPEVYGSPTPEWFTYNDVVPDGTGGSNSITALVAAVAAQTEAVQGMYDKVSAAIADGFSGMTITGNITTGDVKLNDGALVGALTPQVDLKLGWRNKLGLRMG